MKSVRERKMAIAKQKAEALGLTLPEPGAPRNDRTEEILRLVEAFVQAGRIPFKARINESVRGRTAAFTKSVRDLVEAGDLFQEYLPLDLYDRLELKGPRPLVLIPKKFLRPENFWAELRGRVGRGL